MNSLTHKMVTIMVHERLTKDFGVILPIKPLIWGSIRPDFMKHPVSHFKDSQIQFFYTKWEKICLLDPTIQMKYFCQELGEIFHFLCDYFCYAHIEPVFVKDMFKHMKYERQLYKFAKMNNNVAHFFQTAYADYSLLSFPEVIEYKHKLYSKKKQSFENDLTSGFEMCMIAVQKLFAKSAISLNYQSA